VKTQIIFTLIIASLTTCLYANKDELDTNCNRTVGSDWLAKDLPKEICIPNGYLISYHRNRYPTDVNEDGLNDYIFSWNKYPISDGDTVFISIYFQQPDSSYKYFTTFDNLYPIQFRSSTYRQVKDERLKHIFFIYSGYPMKELTFNNDKIIINLIDGSAGSHAGLILTYQFNKERNDWFLVKQESWFQLENTEVTDLGEPEPNQSIRDFNYLKYLE
jgi:hypothetical protein